MKQGGVYWSCLGEREILDQRVRELLRLKTGGPLLGSWTFVKLSENEVDRFGPQ